MNSKHNLKLTAADGCLAGAGYMAAVYKSAAAQCPGNITSTFSTSSKNKVGWHPQHFSDRSFLSHSTQTPSQVVYATTVTALFHNMNQRHTHLLGIVELYSRIPIQISQKLSGFRTSNAHNPLFQHRQCQILCS
jgi:hypothetical protein